LPDNFDAARLVLIERFPEARATASCGCSAKWSRSLQPSACCRAAARFKSPVQAFSALRSMLPAIRDWTLSLSQKLDRTFGNNEAVKAALVANLSYYHDDPATTWWVFFAAAQGSYLLNGGRYVRSGRSASSALLRHQAAGGGHPAPNRKRDRLRPAWRIANLTHTAKDGSNPQIVETRASSAMPHRKRLRCCPLQTAQKLLAAYADRKPSISLFALTLGLSKPPREFGLTSYSTQLLPDWMTVSTTMPRQPR
jgi:hypothetical protein